MIIEVEGDLFSDPSVKAYAHGVNCAGAMGAGIAVQFKERWPAMYAAYRQRVGQGDFAPGKVFVWGADGIVVFNLAIKDHWRNAATVEAIETSLRAMALHMRMLEIDEVAMPRIGAGLGRVAWEDVRAVLERVFGGSELKVRVYARKEA